MTECIENLRSRSASADGVGMSPSSRYRYVWHALCIGRVFNTPLEHQDQFRDVSKRQKMEQRRILGESRHH
jgi:hypothetical protein